MPLTDRASACWSIQERNGCMGVVSGSAMNFFRKGWPNVEPLLRCLEVQVHITGRASSARRLASVQTLPRCEEGQRRLGWTAGRTARVSATIRRRSAAGDESKGALEFKLPVEWAWWRGFGIGEVRGNETAWRHLQRGDCSFAARAPEQC